jgi:hypothetical protein
LVNKNRKGEGFIGEFLDGHGLMEKRKEIQDEFCFQYYGLKLIYWE